MLRQVRNSTDYDVMNAHKLGAKMCPNCRTIIHTSIHLKMIAHNTRFVEIVCKNCNREAASEASATAARAIKQAIDRWNTRWPDICEYLISDSEGIKTYARQY